MWHPGCPRTGLATLTPAGFTGGKQARHSWTPTGWENRAEAMTAAPTHSSTATSTPFTTGEASEQPCSPATRSHPGLTHPASGTAPLSPRGGRWPSAWRGDRLPDLLPVQARAGQGEEVAHAVAGTVTRAGWSRKLSGSWPHGPSSLGAVGALPAAAGHASWLVQGQ